MKQLFKATSYRMYKSTAVRVAVLLTYVVAILYYVLANEIVTGGIDASQAGSVTALGDAMILWIFGSLLIGILVGSDFENKTIHGAIRYGREKIVGNYIIVFLAFIVLLVLPYTIGSIVLIARKSDMSMAKATIVSIYMSNVLVFKEGDSIMNLIVSYLSHAVVYMGQLSICIPVAIKVKKPMVTTVFGFFFGMLTALIATLVSEIKLLDNIYQMTPYAYGIRQIGIQATYVDMCKGIVVSIVFIAICGVIAWLLFRKAEIK